MSTGQQYKLSCKSCRHRKVKCDRIFPCGPCQKSGHECSFPQPMRRPGAKSRNAELTQRLARLETLMGSIGSDPSILGKGTPTFSSDNSDTNSAGVTDQITGLNLQEQKPLIKVDGSRYLSSDFFANLSGEVDGLRQLLNEASDDEEDGTGRSSSISHPSHTSETSDPPSLLLFQSSAGSDLRSLHPSPAHISALAALYFSRVDPKFKILHRQTTLSLIFHVSRNPGSYTPGQESLLFAIYYSVIISSSDNDCLSRFGEQRAPLLMKYKMALETSMVQANILETTEIAALQALSIYIVCSRVDEGGSRSAWTLFATAVRIAQAMEVDRDGTLLGLSAFETEMRRRMWWQLIVLDAFYSEARGTVPIIREDTFDTLPPLNINDDQLSDVAGVIGEEVIGGTEMTFSRISQEASLSVLRIFALNPRSRKLQEETVAVFQAREKLAAETAEAMYSKWWANCKGNPSYWDCAGVASIIICRIWLALHRSMASLRPQTLKPASREYVLAASVCNLELVEAQMDLANEPFRWYTRGYVPWQPLAIMLSELCIQTSGWLVDRAWALAHLVYASVSEVVADSKNGSLFRPIKKLLYKARQVRLASQFRSNLLATQEPEWMGLYSTPWSQLSDMPGFYDLHDATIEMIVGRPERLQVMLENNPTPPIIEPDIEPSAFNFDTSLAGSISPDFVDDTMEPIDWENWNSILQTSLSFEQPLPNADKSYWPLS